MFQGQVACQQQQPLPLWTLHMTQGRRLSGKQKDSVVSDILLKPLEKKHR